MSHHLLPDNHSALCGGVEEGRETSKSGQEPWLTLSSLKTSAPAVGPSLHWSLTASPQDSGKCFLLCAPVVLSGGFRMPSASTPQGAPGPHLGEGVLYLLVGAVPWAMRLFSCTLTTEVAVWAVGRKKKISKPDCLKMELQLLIT